MQLSLQNFTSLVETMAAAVQSAASQLIDLTVGSTLRAILEANASIALWVQWLILQVLQMTRAATSTGQDLDSWMADMSLTRLPAVAATGTVTFSRYSGIGTSLIPAGALVRTADGSRTFAVTIDTSNAAWTASLNGYTIAEAQTALTVPVVAQVAGNAGNVLANAITLLATAMPGVDTVINAAPLQNGADAESDSAFRTRFVNYINSRSRATPAAVQYAIASVKQGLTYAIAENLDSAGNARAGSFVVTVDDGTGYPPATLLADVSEAVEAVRPIGSTFTVQPPTIVVANVTLTIVVANPGMKAVAAAQVMSALTSYIDALAIGTALPMTRVAQVAYGANSAVVNVTMLQINGGVEDLNVSASSVVKAGVISVN
jgi:uncharacterized phage protein gp47/JayE